jgi:hypothetical protein
VPQISEHERAEAQMRVLLENGGLPEPDEVEYDEASIVLRWVEQELTVVVDLDPDAELADAEPRGP